MWWLNAENKFPNIPTSVYYAEGFGGNFIIVDNEHDIVVVARWLDSEKPGELLNLVIRAVDGK